MLRDGSCAVDGVGDGEVGGGGEWSRPARRSAWQDVDRALRRNARQRSALDAEEARLLCEAERLQVWRPLGMVSMIDYLERVLGYAPRTAQDRMRVARALANLPALTEALAHNEVTFSAVEDLADLPQQREGRGGKLVAHDVGPYLGVGWIARVHRPAYARRRAPRSGADSCRVRR